MKSNRMGPAMALVAAGALVVLGATFAQSGVPYDNPNGWSQMMMGPMAGCPMGAGNHGLMGPYMMGPQMMGPGMMHQGMMGPGHMGWGQWPADIAPQIDAMRSALAIRPAQQDAWAAYAAAARADTQSMTDMHGRMVAFMQGKTTSALDWLHVHRDMMRARANSLDALTGAAERLYGQLDATQKASFDRYGGGMCGAW